MANNNPGNIVRLHDHAAFTRRFSPASAVRLLHECRDTALERLAKTAARSLDNVDDALFALADKAETNVLQGRYFDAMREIRLQRRDIESSFKTHFGEAADKLIAIAPQDASMATVRFVADAGFSLVEHDDLEETLAVNALTDKLEALCHGELFALNERVGFLLDKDVLKSADNPLGPKTLCQAFKAACGSIESGVDIKIIVFKLFDKYLCEDILALYHDINSHLAANGVLPKLAPQIKSESASHAGGIRHQGTAMNSATNGAETDFLSAFAQLLATSRPQLNAAMNLESSPAGMPNILHDLTLLQRGQWETLGMQAAGIDPAVLGDGTKNVVRIIKDNAMAGGLGGNGNVVIEVVALLFDYIFENKNIPDRAKALIGRLQIPVLKVAILDTTFFSKRHHPARRLLNTLAHATVGLHDEDAEHSELYEELESCIQRVQVEFDTDIDVFATALKNLEAYLDTRQLHLDENIEEAKKVLQGRERLKIAESLAEDEIEKKLKGKHFPEFIKTFAMDRWKNLLIVAYLKEGQESDTWKSRLEMLDLLIWSALPKATPKDKKKLVEMLPTLIVGIETGMRLLAMTDPEQHEFLEKLANCHARAVNAEFYTAEEPPRHPLNSDFKPPRNESIPANAPGVKPSVVQRGSLQIEEITLLGSSGVSKTDGGEQGPKQRLQSNINPFGDMQADKQDTADQAPVQAPVADEYTELMANLVPGIWFTFKREDGSETMERLSWISAVLDTYLFTNHEGIKTREIGAPELEGKLRGGQVVLADDMSFLVDRSLSSLLDEMQKKVNGR